MPTLRTSFLTAGAGLAAVALTALVTVTPAAAAPAASLGVTTAAVPAAAGWLTTQFVGSNHLPAPAGDHFDSKYGKEYYPNYGENADVVFGLAAAKAGAAKITTAMNYLAVNADAYADLSKAQGGPYDGSVAKLALADIVAGGDPTAFAGSNLLKVLKDDECDGTQATCPAGSAANIYSGVSESFVILAEARVGGVYTPSTQAMSYLLSLQCASGGFTSGTTACAAGDEDIDATSYAIMALQAAGGHAKELGSAVSWLEGKRAAGGYWVSQGAPNTNSTGLAAAALQGTGTSVSLSRTWLRSQQVARGRAGAGALKYAGKVEPTTADATSSSVLATAQGLVGLVDDGSLATLTSAGSTSQAAVFAPTGSLSTAALRPGAKVTVSVNGFSAGETLQVAVHSTPVVLATPSADALGAATSTVTLPTALSAGAHTIQIVGASSGLTVTEAITVAGAPSSTSGSGSTSPGTGATAPLAATGQDGPRLVGLAIVGMLAVLGGLGLVLLGRTRRHA